MKRVGAKAKGLVKLAAIGGVMLLGACSEVIRNHGYAPTDVELQDVIVGVDTRDTVASSIGEPAASGVLREGGWYYVGSTKRHYAYRKPKEIDRQVVAITFNAAGVVENVERFGLENGQVVALSRRVTETTVRDVTFIRQIIRNIGRIDLGEALNN
jgi:outer membrane protein assembly factor BamE (lipoprotein component of BamABCDE complex)